MKNDGISELLLMATIQVKTSIDQVVPLLEMGAERDADYKGVYEAYVKIQEQLGKASKILTEMK